MQNCSGFEQVVLPGDRRSIYASIIIIIKHGTCMELVIHLALSLKHAGNNNNSVTRFTMCYMLLFQFLIGYNRGLIVLWDSKENNAEQTYNATQVGYPLT